jgi:exonuclease III
MASNVSTATATEETAILAKTEDSKHPSMKICTFNIMHGGNARLEAALRSMSQMNMDLGVFTETKLVDGHHTTSCEGFEVITTKAKSKHQGGVAIFHKQSRHWHIEGTKTFGPNVIQTELVSGKSRWILVGAYIPPSEVDGTTISWIERATNGLNHPLILLGDLNINIHQPPVGGYNKRQEDTLNLIASLGLTDLRRHFSQRTGWKEWTWSHKRADGFRDRNICDYILTQERSHFSNFQIRQPRFDSDHRLIQGILSLQPERNTKLMSAKELNSPSPSPLINKVKQTKSFNN